MLKFVAPWWNAMNTLHKQHTRNNSCSIPYFVKFHHSSQLKANCFQFHTVDMVVCDKQTKYLGLQFQTLQTLTEQTQIR